MPRKAEWIHRIPQALAVLRASPAPLVDRRDLERLLDVSGRHAVRLLHRLGCWEAGKNLFIAREDLVTRLERIHSGEDARYERQRLQRLDHTLAALGRDLRARQIPVQATPAARDMVFPALSPAVRLRPGRLEIEFQTPEDLLTLLFEFSQAVANDYGHFECLSRGAPGPSGC